MGVLWKFMEGAASEVRHYPKHSVVVHQGDRMGDILVVRSGLLRLYSVSAEGQYRLIRLAHPGDVVGLMSAFLRLTMQVSVEAAFDSEVGVIPATSLQSFLAEHPLHWEQLFHYALSVGMLHSSRGRVTPDSRAEGRVRHALALLAKPSYSRPDQSMSDQVLIPLTHQDLADYCCLNRVTVTLALKQLQRQGCVALKRGCIIIKSIKSLQTTG